MSPEEWREQIQRSAYYDAIAMHYGTRTAERSKVPLIQHIDEGLLIMARAGASVGAMQAYCLHPLFQSDEALTTVGLALFEKWPRTMFPTGNVMMLVMEYRHQANAWLSDKVRLLASGHFTLDGQPTPGPLGEVRMMLIGDKVQNCKDFMRYHFGTHPRSKELDQYFMLWLKALGVSHEQYNRLVEGL